MILLRVMRFALALVLCSVALTLPYRARVAYSRAAASVAHLPFILFGRLARFLLERLGPPARPPA